jgi:AraC family transcriptional regulator
MEPKIIKKSAFKVTGFERKTTNIGGVNYRELPQFWDRYFAENWAKILHGRIKPVQDADLGLCFPGGMEKGEFSYVIGVEVGDFNDIPAEMFRGEVPAATYAVFTTPPAEREGGGFSKVIQKTWDYVFAEWFPNSGYEFDDKSKIDFELYDERAQGDHGIQIDIYVPVVKRDSEGNSSSLHKGRENKGRGIHWVEIKTPLCSCRGEFWQCFGLSDEISLL